MIMIDKMAYSSSLRYKNPYIKTAFSTGAIISCLILKNVIWSIIIMLLMGSLTIFYGKTPFKYYIKLLLIPATFIIVSTITIVLEISTVKDTLLNIRIAQIYIVTNKALLYNGINIALRAFASVSCLYFLSLTTPLTDIFKVLKRMHMPALIIEIMLLMYRFIFILLEMGEALSISKKSRLSNKDMKTSIKSTAGMFGVIFIRAIKKTAYIYDAMESRCYDGDIRTLNYVKDRKKDEYN